MAAPRSGSPLMVVVVAAVLVLLLLNNCPAKCEIASASATAKPTLPSYLKICHRSDPKISECIKESVEALRPYLKKGIPELGIPPCEPLHIPELVINQGRGPVSVKSTYSNILVHGPSSFTLKSVKVDMAKDRFKFKLYIPNLEMSSHYKMEGRILMLPISGNGHSAGNYSDIDATCTIHGEKVHRDDQTFFNVKHVSAVFNIGNAKVKLDDLFNGDKELGDAMNMFLNDNWRNVANEMKPVLEQTIGDLFKKFANKLYRRFPLDMLLPP